MRVLMLSQFYPPTIGGEETHVRTLSTELVARGHDVAVATLWHEGLPSYELDKGVRVHRVRGTLQRATWLFSEMGRRHIPPFPDPEAVLALRRLIARERPDIVHAHNWLVHSFWPIKALSRAHLVLTLHDYSLTCAKKRLMYQDAPCSGPGLVKCLRCATDYYGLKGAPVTLTNWASSVAERAAVDMVLAVSRATAVGNGLPTSGLPYQVIPNFVPDDLAAIRQIDDPRLAELPEGDFLLFVGDLGRDKGVDVLLRAYRTLRDAPPLVLIGRVGTETPADLPANVMLFDSWPHALVLEAWRRCTIGLVPSVWSEPFGIVAIEAMAMGRPVIASRIGGLPDIVTDGETGLLLPPGDVDALAAAIARLLDDRETRERMGQAGARKAAEFHVSTVVPRIERVYEQLMEAHPRPINASTGQKSEHA